MIEYDYPDSSCKILSGTQLLLNAFVFVFVYSLIRFFITINEMKRAKLEHHLLFNLGNNKLSYCRILANLMRLYSCLSHLHFFTLSYYNDLQWTAMTRNMYGFNSSLEEKLSDCI